jgi:hypothetical protein
VTPGSAESQPSQVQMVPFLTNFRIFAGLYDLLFAHPMSTMRRQVCRAVSFTECAGGILLRDLLMFPLNVHTTTTVVLTTDRVVKRFY